MAGACTLIICAGSIALGPLLWGYWEYRAGFCCVLASRRVCPVSGSLALCPLALRLLGGAALAHCMRWRAVVFVLFVLSPCGFAAVWGHWGYWGYWGHWEWDVCTPPIIPIIPITPIIASTFDTLVGTFVETSEGGFAPPCGSKILDKPEINGFDGRSRCRKSGGRDAPGPLILTPGDADDYGLARSAAAFSSAASSRSRREGFPHRTELDQTGLESGPVARTPSALEMGHCR